MPQPWRLSLSQVAGLSNSGGALVTSATSSSFRPVLWRTSRATWAAMGKPMSSACATAVRMARFSSLPLFFSWVLASVRLACPRGEIRSGSGDFLFYVGPQCGLVFFDGEQIITPAFENNRPRGFVLSVQRVQADETSAHIQGRQ